MTRIHLTSLHPLTVEVNFGDVGEVAEALPGDLLGAVKVVEEVEDLPEEEDEVDAVGVGRGLEHLDQEVRGDEIGKELGVSAAKSP